MDSDAVFRDENSYQIRGQQIRVRSFYQSGGTETLMDKLVRLASQAAADRIKADGVTLGDAENKDG